MSTGRPFGPSSKKLLKPADSPAVTLTMTHTTTTTNGLPAGISDGRYHAPPFHVVESATGRIVAETWTAHCAFRVTEEMDRQTLQPHHVRNAETGRTVR